MRVILLIAISLLWMPVIGQNTDSLIQVLSQTKNDSVVLNLYNSILRSAEYSNPKLALKYSELIIEHPLNQEPKYKSRNLINHGKLLKNIGKFDSATLVMLEGIKIAESIGELKTQAMGYNSLGVIFKSNSDWDAALEYYKLSNKVCTEMKYIIGMAMTLNNIGTIYDAKNQLDSALKYYHKAATIGQQNDLTDVKAISYNNIGEVLAKQGMEVEAIPYFFKTLACDSSTNNYMGMATTLLNIANSYKVLGHYEKSFSFFEKAKSSISKVNSAQLYIMYYHGLADAYEKNGNITKSYEIYKKYHTLNDSIYNSTKSQQIAELKTKYETEKKELAINNLSQKNQIIALEVKKTQNQLISVLMISLALIIISILSYFQLKNIQKRKITQTILDEQQKGLNAVILAEEEERKRIAKDLHDGIGQELSGIKLFISKINTTLKSQGSPLVDEMNKLESVIDNTCAEVRDISHKMMPRTLMEQGLVEAIADMLQKGLGHTDIKFHFEHYNIKNRFEERVEIALFRISQELISNIIKHSKASEVSIQLIKNNNSLILIMEDNGVGLSNHRKKDGIGQLNMSSRINNLNGSFFYDSEVQNGTLVTVKIPLG